MPPVSSYGEGQLDKLMYVCQAKAECQGAMGGAASSPQDVMNCAAVYVGSLDLWSPTQRTQYEQTFAMCSTLTGCQFLGCFPFQ
jgi:hypothetical protein